MSKQYHKLMLGALLIFFDLNVGIDILPDFLGYIFMASGAFGLYELTKQRGFMIATGLYSLLVILNVIGWFTPMAFDELSLFGHISFVVSLLSSGMSYYYVGSGILEHIREEVERRNLIQFTKIYLVYHLLFAFLMCFYNFITSDIFNMLMVVLTIVGIMITVTFLFHLRRIRDYLKEIDIDTLLEY